MFNLHLKLSFCDLLNLQVFMDPGIVKIKLCLADSYFYIAHSLEWGSHWDMDGGEHYKSEKHSLTNNFNVVLHLW